MKLLREIRFIGSGFTRGECETYGFLGANPPADPGRYLSNRTYHEQFQPLVNRGPQKHILEDKWVFYRFLEGLFLPLPSTLGLFHPAFGVCADGSPLRDTADFERLLLRNQCDRIVLKPRGGRQGAQVTIATVVKGPQDELQLELSGGKRSGVEQFLSGVTSEEDSAHYGGGYDGWVVQAYIDQHDFLNEINPTTINTFRVITFLGADQKVRIQMAALRLGRLGSAIDSWMKGGVSVHVDVGSGRLGSGAIRGEPQRVSAHPDTKTSFEGKDVPDWEAIKACCIHAASCFSGVRSIGWDVALSSDGPMIVEANAVWVLPLVQVHTQGYLSDEVQGELAALGIGPLSSLRSLPGACTGWVRYRLERSTLGSLTARLRQGMARPAGRRP